MYKQARKPKIQPEFEHISDADDSADRMDLMMSKDKKLQIQLAASDNESSHQTKKTVRL